MLLFPSLAAPQSINAGQVGAVGARAGGCTQFVHSRGRVTIWSVAPVAYQVILEPGIGQFREFEPRRVHTINSLGLFLVDKLTCEKRESVS